MSSYMKSFTDHYQLHQSLVAPWSPIFTVLEVSLIKYQQIDPDITAAAQQMFTFLFIFISEYTILNS